MYSAKYRRRQEVEKAYTTVKMQVLRFLSWALNGQRDKGLCFCAKLRYAREALKEARRLREAYKNQEANGEDA